MDVDDQLRALLQDAGSRLELEPASLTEVTRRGDRRRARARLGGAAAVVLAAGVAGGALLLRDDGGGGAIAADGSSTTTTSADTSTTAAPSASGAAVATTVVAASSSTAGIGGDIGSVVPWDGGFLSFVVEQGPQPIPELSEELTSRFPPEVAELFADDPPESIQEAIERLTEAGLIDVVNEIVTSDAALRDAIYAEPAPPPSVELRWSAEGTTWAPVGSRLPAGVGYPVQLAAGDTHVVVVGQAPGDGSAPGSIVVASTTDLGTWDVRELTPGAPADLPDWVDLHWAPGALAVGPDGWVMSVSGHDEPDLPIPASVTDGSESWGMSWAPDDGGVTVTTQSGDEVFVTWEEMGIDAADVDRFLSARDPLGHLVVGRWGGDPAQVDLSVDHPYSIVSTGAGFALAGSTERGETQVLVSADGLSWREVTELPDRAAGAGLAGLAAVEGGILLTVDDGDGTTVWLGDAGGGSWREVVIPGLPPDTGRYWLTLPSGTGGGLATVVDLAVVQAAPVVERLELEEAGFRVVFLYDEHQQGYELSDAATGTVLVSESSSWPDEEGALYDHLRMGPEGFTFTDPGTGGELLHLSQARLDEAFTDAYAEAGYDVDRPYSPDWWLLATRDGTTWLVEDLPDGGDRWYGPAALGDDEVVVWGSDEVRRIPFG